MAIGGSKEVRSVLRFAEANGFVLARTTKHFILKRGSHTVSLSMSPSCPYGPSNAMRDIKRCLASEQQK